MKNKLITIAIIICFVVMIVSCDNTPPVIHDNDYPDSNLTMNEKINWWLDKLTIAEKAGQMVQGERSNNNGASGVKPTDVRNLNLGSVLNGGGNRPSSNTTFGWVSMYENMLNASLESSSKIPIIYGVDAVHGHNNLYGATIFPHNIGLAAANNKELMKEIGMITAYEMGQTGMNMNFSPSIGLIKDKRWGRTYETLGESPDIALNLIPSYIEGIQSYGVIGSAKHFVGDGYTTFGTGLDNKLDRGNSTISKEDLETIHFPLYEAAIEAGVKSIMVSYSSLNDVRMHENKELITDILKDQMGFKGFVIGDYNGIDDIRANTFYERVIKGVNAGIDMLMQPHNFKEVIDAIVRGVEEDRIDIDRINDAVSRILSVKYEMGLFDEKTPIESDLRSENALNVARKAVRESMVLLKNNQNLLPFNKDLNLLILGKGSQNIGIQSGGWTIDWQGSDQLNIPGTTIVDAFKSVTNGQIYTDINDIDKADQIIIVFSEKPSAEMMGDSLALSLTDDTSYASNQTLIDIAKQTNKPVIGLLLSGKPLIIEEVIPYLDAFVMLFLPGSEGLGITDVLYGDYNFKGKLPFTWPKSISQSSHTVLDENYEPSDYRYPFGYGLNYTILQ
ncbi:glycoside hydrolase family 3 protein [Acholeplasma laidlawii]|uniref:beta-glucosidase n=2 Tax=Acholeplasma laidlawii TaxID=2148 RepID=A9NG51_ACHLI|nr:glycoside hydrolase family 3 N-terminal domain-containing protein [Acholeplasma laidlawii]ABX81331.1 glycosyl hydrolase, family 3 [Acholeplasma laidlawii PG-8A]NWH10089.1 glycoside hydrolase family 3 protein [Acholeplasma laidlawii]NWH11479.1 glycoside hydrolase family 3 protein [Acholeplasma laidlawii]NWH13111.1 glycoside hydrolase family 3 protein [Acholeplasma laidlawii]NWH14621.1 glycoside hydrolase family 3 protein [Acholeplasma laidlawii]